MERSRKALKAQLVIGVPKVLFPTPMGFAKFRCGAVLIAGVGLHPIIYFREAKLPTVRMLEQANRRTLSRYRSQYGYGTTIDDVSLNRQKPQETTSKVAATRKCYNRGRWHWRARWKIQRWAADCTTIVYHERKTPSQHLGLGQCRNRLLFLGQIIHEHRGRTGNSGVDRARAGQR